MQKLTAFINKAIKGDPLEVYSLPNATQQDFIIALDHFQSLSFSKKMKYIQHLNRKLQNQRSNRQVLNILIIFFLLLEIAPQNSLVYPSSLLLKYEQKRKIKSNSKQQRNKLAQDNFILFYLQYLRQKMLNKKPIEVITLFNLKECLNYCQSNIITLKLTIRHDFIIEYALSHSDLKNQIFFILKNILQRNCEDLGYLIRFIDKWSVKISEDNIDSIQINDIYEQLIYVSKNVMKLESLASKIKCKFNFPRYNINKQVNQTIQKVMLSKQNQKRSFYSQKRLKTQSDTYPEHQEVTQSQIMVKLNL